MEGPAEAVSAVLANDREALLLDESLDHMADIAGEGAGPNLAIAAPHRIEAHLAQTGRLYRWRADHEHPARVAVVAVLDDADVDIHYVAVAQRSVARDAVAHDMVHGRADRLGKRRRAGRAAVVQG